MGRAGQGRARVGRAGQACREPAGGRTEGTGRTEVRTDPERVDVVLMMLSRLPTRVTGSEPGPASHSSLWGIA